MHNLFQFLVRYSAAFLFILLELICFILIIRNNDAQREIFLNSSNVIAAKTNQLYDKMVEYSKLQETVDSLINQQARLKSKLYNSQQYLAFQKTNVQDSLYNQHYNTISAQVINNSITSRNNTITINRGRKDGIKPGMGIIGETGIVGIVKYSTNSFASAISILNSSTRISTSFKRKPYFGTMVWQGFNPTKMSLERIPKHADILAGDTLETSGYSHIFPAGIMIGTVDTFWLERGSNWFHIDVSLVNDLSKTDIVYVIENLLKAEQDSLEKRMVNE